MPHRLLRTLLLLSTAALAMRLAAQTPAAPPNATANDPFAPLAAKPALEPAASGMRVVVQKPDGTPAPDAIVVFTPWRDDEAARAEREAAKQRFPTDEPLRFALLAANGTRHRLDERGGTRVPRKGYVFAFAGDLAARHYVSEDTTEPRLVVKLVAARDVTVEVVTADGKPAAAVPFAVFDAPRHSGDPEPTTDNDGTATLRLLRTRPETAFVQLAVATKNPVRGVLPREAGRVRLQLPPTTTVTATFAGELVPGAELDWELQCGENAAEVAGERTGQRSARWRYVETDAAFTITGKSTGLDLATASGTATANAEPIALLRQQKVATFAMQILDPDGKPACNREVEPHWTSQRGSANTWGARTNREGWLELAAPSHLGARGGLQLLLLLVPNARGPMEGFAKVTVDAAAVGRTVLPPVRCERSPVLAAGMLTTPDGKPVPSFLLGVYTPTYQRVTTDAEGRFAIRGIEQGQPIRLRLDSEWCFAKGAPWSAELAENSKDVRLVVQRAGRVRFAADLPADLHTRIRYRLEPANGEGDRVELPSLTPNELHVPAGHWHFVAYHDGMELLRLENLRAESGVETHDPRFMAFDWRAYAIVVKVTVRDSKGEPCDQCTVWVRNGGSGSGRSPTNGVLHLLLPKDGGKVDIEPRDHAIAGVDLGVITEDQVVVLGGGPRLTVTLTPMPKLPEDAQLLLVVGADGNSVPFDGNGKATVSLPKAGVFTPRLDVRKGDVSSGSPKLQLPAIEVPKEGKQCEVEMTAERREAIAELLRGLSRL